MFRIAPTRFRASSHVLEIERGRYTIPSTPIENRLCHMCQVIENEVHFLIECKIYGEHRHTLFSKVIEIFPYFSTLPGPEKFIFLLCNSDSKILTWVGRFIYEAFESRTIFHLER